MSFVDGSLEAEAEGRNWSYLNSALYILSISSMHLHHEHHLVAYPHHAYYSPVTHVCDIHFLERDVNYTRDR